MYIYTSYCKLNMERTYKPYSTPKKKGNPREILVFTYSHPSYQSSPKKKHHFGWPSNQLLLPSFKMPSVRNTAMNSTAS